jgi:phosphoadenosine phosphosulfate reductase
MARLNQQEIRRVAKEYERETAGEVLAWALKEFGNRVALATNFGAKDVVLTDMLVKIDPKARICCASMEVGQLASGENATTPPVGDIIRNYASSFTFVLFAVIQIPHALSGIIGG